MMDFRDWQGKAVLDRDGQKVGSIGQLYIDDRNSAPAWATVKTGAFGTKETFFPVSLAHVQGEDIVVDMPEAEIKNAPNIEVDEKISPDEEEKLYQYYREKWQATQSDDTDDNISDDSRRDDKADDSDQDSDIKQQGADMAAAADSDTEEQDDRRHLHLRKYVVTEYVSDDGNVQRKEVIIEKQPIDKDKEDSDRRED